MEDQEKKIMREPAQPDTGIKEKASEYNTVKKKIKKILQDDDYTDGQKVGMLKAYLG